MKKIAMMLSFLFLFQVAAFAAVEPAPTPNWSLLSDSDREILRKGEMPTNQYVLGGIVGTVIGLGVGQAIQDRYIPNGLIITVGEVVSFTMMMVGVANCVGDAMVSTLSNNRSNCSSGLLTAGALVYVGFRVWEIVDLWAMPPIQNARYRELKRWSEQAHTAMGLFPVINTENNISGAGLALQYRF